MHPITRNLASLSLLALGFFVYCGISDKYILQEHPWWFISATLAAIAIYQWMRRHLG